MGRGFTVASSCSDDRPLCAHLIEQVKPKLALLSLKPIVALIISGDCRFQRIIDHTVHQEPSTQNEAQMLHRRGAQPAQFHSAVESDLAGSASQRCAVFPSEKPRSASAPAIGWAARYEE
jgi:hypothetical protein